MYLAIRPSGRALAANIWMAFVARFVDGTTRFLLIHCKQVTFAGILADSTKTSDQDPDLPCSPSAPAGRQQTRLDYSKPSPPGTRTQQEPSATHTRSHPNGRASSHTLVAKPRLMELRNSRTPPAALCREERLAVLCMLALHRPAAEASVKIRWGRLRTAAILRIVLPAHASFDVRFRG